MYDMLFSALAREPIRRNHCGKSGATSSMPTPSSKARSPRRKKDLGSLSYLFPTAVAAPMAPSRPRPSFNTQLREADPAAAYPLPIPTWGVLGGRQARGLVSADGRRQQLGRPARGTVPAGGRQQLQARRSTG